MTTGADRFADVLAGIRVAVAAHAQAQDDGRTDDLVELYCTDGAVEVPDVGVFEGRDVLRETFAGWAPQLPQRHVVTNTVVTDWDEREAVATSDVVFLQKTDAGWSVQVVGRYHDRFRNDAGTWRIARRQMNFVT
jgi:ketosteroid isomerase-like protein